MYLSKPGAIVMNGRMVNMDMGLATRRWDRPVGEGVTDCTRIAKDLRSLTRMIHDGSSRNRVVALRACPPKALRSSEYEIAAEVLMNHAGQGGQFRSVTVQRARTSSVT
jgi:hypothetical protein